MRSAERHVGKPLPPQVAAYGCEGVTLRGRGQRYRRPAREWSLPGYVERKEERAMSIDRPGDGRAMLTKSRPAGVQPHGSAITAACGEYPENISVTSRGYASAAIQWPHRKAFGDTLSDNRLNVSENRSHQKLTLRTPHVNHAFTRGYLSRLRLVRVAMV